MLMTVLKGERAIAQSKALIRLFKQMKDYIVAENHQLIGTAGFSEMALQMAQISPDVRGTVETIGDMIWQAKLSE